MTDNPNAVSVILEKLEELKTSVNDLQGKVNKFNAYMQYQPQLDEQTHIRIDDRFERIEERVKSLEHSQIWAYRLIIMTSLTTVVSIILSVINR